MNKHIDVVVDPATDEFPMADMEVGDVCILTRCPHGVPPGTVVVKAGSEWSFPGTGAWSSTAARYFVRRIRPNEQVIIKGK